MKMDFSKAFLLLKISVINFKAHSLALTVNNNLLLDNSRIGEDFSPYRNVQEVAVVSFSCELCHLL